MYLKKLTLLNFKNYPGGEFLFSDKINCLTGNNGVGKTNLLDAIYYLSFCKSFFLAADSQNIRHGEDFFSIMGTYTRKDDQTDRIQCIQKRNARKKFLVNSKEYERFADHIGCCPLVMISPYDRDLINDGSEIRRKYIDGVISQFNRIYLDDLILYQKALFQRNILLKSFAENKKFDPSLLEPWDLQLVTLGNRIHDGRKEFLSGFIPVFRHYFSLVFDSDETVDIRYQSQLQDSDFGFLLKECIDRDRASQFSTTGIHKDDLEFLYGGYPLKKIGSQGQQKSFLIAVKLAQFDYTRKKMGYKPILLLDDIFDKLDDLRVEHLIRLVSENNFGQVFITDTSPERISRIFGGSGITYKLFTLGKS